jgi:D-alanyl-D-alanine carboxypeptidase (penicillin-binding protein 5/6)
MISLSRARALIVAAIMASGGFAPIASAHVFAPKIGAQAAILFDPRTHAILYEKHAFRQLDPASLTKMMTAYIVIRGGHLDRTVTVSPQAAATPGSRLNIRPGETYTRYDLLTGLLLRSGNDAAVQLAESEAGSVTRFVAEMNVAAQALGAFNTHFENPHGLTAPGHYSSAYDLANIAQAALSLKTFRAIVRLPQASITERSRHRHRLLHNTNQLLYGFPGADGIKTGTTNAAGKCLAASATRNGRQLIAVVLNSPDRWRDASALLHWGFLAWSTVLVVRAGEPVAHLTVLNGTKASVALAPRQDLWASVPRGSQVEQVLAVPASLTAPVPVKPVGSLTVIAPNQPPHRVSLWVTHAVARQPWWSRWRPRWHAGPGYPR